jgi:putative DNA primase/helicase
LCIRTQVTILSRARILSVSGSACQPSRRKKVRHRDCQKSLSHNIKTRQTLTMLAASWREAANIRGSIAEHYLNSRSLVLDDYSDRCRVLRFHPCCPFGPDRAPAMIALMRDVMTNDPRCIQRTRLAPDGSKIARQMLGPSKGAAIKIDADHDVTMGLCIGEGLETCLTARQCDVKPVWALGSVGAIEAFPVLAGIDALSILAETGDASARAVKECGDRWEHDGREVFILDSKIGSDVNDALREVAQ